jgi:hypothetical protein
MALSLGAWVLDGRVSRKSHFGLYERSWNTQ